MNLLKTQTRWPTQTEQKEKVPGAKAEVPVFRSDTELGFIGQ